MQPVDSTVTSCAPPATPQTPSSTKPFSQHVILDPKLRMPQDVRSAFQNLLLEYEDVLNPSISRYNGASGKIEAVVDTLPPQRKGRTPQYNRTILEELQFKFDELEAAGEHVNVKVEYLNTSFLVRRPNGGSRLVTSFGSVTQYSKPQPSLTRRPMLTVSSEPLGSGSTWSSPTS